MLRWRDRDGDRGALPTMREVGSAGPTAPMRSEDSVIGPDDVFTGDYSFARGVRVQGCIEGSVEAKGSVHIERQGRVLGEIAAADITIAGEHRGGCRCRGTLRVITGGRVIGEIYTNTLLIEEGAHVEGVVRMGQRVIL